MCSAEWIMKLRRSNIRNFNMNYVSRILILQGESIPLTNHQVQAGSNYRILHHQLHLWLCHHPSILVSMSDIMEAFDQDCRISKIPFPLVQRWYTENKLKTFWIGFISVYRKIVSQEVKNLTFYGKTRFYHYISPLTKSSYYFTDM